MARAEDVAKALEQSVGAHPDLEKFHGVMLQFFAAAVARSFDEWAWQRVLFSTQTDDGDGLVRNLSLVGDVSLSEALTEIVGSAIFVEAFLAAFFRERDGDDKNFEEEVNEVCGNFTIEISRGVFHGEKFPGDKDFNVGSHGLGSLIGIVIGERLSGFIGSEAALSNSRAAVEICRRMSERSGDSGFGNAELFKDLKLGVFVKSDAGIMRSK